MTRRGAKALPGQSDDEGKPASPLCNGHRTITRQSSQELLKVQCNGLSGHHRTSKLLSPSGSDVLPLGSARRASRRASASWCGSTRELASQLSQLTTLGPLSPSDGEDASLSPGVTLRPKGTLWLPVALIGTTAEENGNSPRRRTERLVLSDRTDSRDSFKSSSLSPHSDPEGPKHNGALSRAEKRSQSETSARRPRTKKLSHEERFLQDNKEYFKMEVLNTKLRSSGSLLNHDSETDAKPIEKIIIKKIKTRGKRRKKKRDYAAIIIAPKNGIIRKKRQSELVKLCDEAESFMFGESSRQGSENDKKLGMEESSMDSSCEEKRRKKRRSHAEAFIHDNLDYYKFETPGSRLRYQTDVIVKQEDFSVMDRQVENVVYSFERVPSTEPWYSVYQRQDMGLEDYYPLMSDPADQPFCLPYELPKLPPPVPGVGGVGVDVSEALKRRRRRLALANHPRKSPRCHASTLAILSSLKKRKRRSGSGGRGKSPPPPPRPDTPPVEREGSPEPVDQLEELGTLGSLGNEWEELEMLEPICEEGRSRKKQEECRFQWYEPDACIDRTPHPGLKIPVMDLLRGYAECSSMEDEGGGGGVAEVEGVESGGGASQGKAGPGRGVKRKARKINKTGWDKKVRRKASPDKKQDGGIDTENILTDGNKRRKTEVMESRSASADSSSREYTQCIVRVRKMKVPEGEARYVIQNRRLVLSRRKTTKRRKVTDYSWGSRKR